MRKPSISVIIPTCYRNDLLASCLNCLAPGIQTLTADHYEIIITDDGLNTTAEQMVHDLYPWARWVAGPRKGPAANRNNGATFALGEWLAFTDDDCLPEPGWLEAFTQATTKGTDIYEGKTICRAGIRSPIYTAPINMTGGFLWSCNMMIRYSVFKQVEGFDEQYPYAAMEDVDLRERLTRGKHNISFVQNAIVDHPPRKRPSAMRLAAQHECQVLFWHKMGQRPPSLISHLYSIVLWDFRILKRTPMSIATLLAFNSMALELFLIAIKMNAWKKKYTLYRHP